MTNIVKKNTKNEIIQEKINFLIIRVMHCFTGLYVNSVILNIYK